METFLSHRAAIVDELVRRDGLQEHLSPPQCAVCLDELGTYRCTDCTVLTLYCASCIVHEHESTPLHRLEVCRVSSDVLFHPSHVRSVLERRILRTCNAQRLGLPVFPRSRTHLLSIIGLNPNYSRYQWQWGSLHQRPILWVHGESPMG